MNASSSPIGPSSGSLLVDHELEALFGTSIRASPGASALSRTHVSPASLDLRLGPNAWRIRAGFLPSDVSIEQRVNELALSRQSLEGDGAVLERGLAYLVPLEEELALPTDLRGRFNPRSSTGRCDICTRILCDRHPRFDEAPPGYAGRLWIEIAPLSFPVRLKRGDRLAQLRLSRGNAALSESELRAVHAQTPLCFEGARALTDDEIQIDADGGLAVSVGLIGRDPIGWRAGANTEPVEFAREGAHDPIDFWEPLHARDGRAILAPGSFYIFASQERLRIPPDLAAEMLPIDVGVGELRNNYAGFFDNGFGWNDAKPAPAKSPNSLGAKGPQRGSPHFARVPASLPGTPAVLEVRAHDVPFLVEHGQPFGRLRFFRTGKPRKVYGEGRPASYRDQDLTLARCFRRP
jgi:dCTP deaminase